MFTLSDIPCWYLVIAFILSFYQAFRGFMFQLFFPANKLMDELKKIRGAKVWKIVLVCLADAVTYFLSAMSGSISIFMFYQFTSQATTALKDQAGTILLIFLVLYGILGVTGKLPELLNKIKFLGTG
jgi:hypothetical protein